MPPRSRGKPPPKEPASGAAGSSAVTSLSPEDALVAHYLRLDGTASRFAVSGAATAEASVLRQMGGVLKEIADIRRARGDSEPVDPDALIAALTDNIDSLPESVFARLAQAVEARRASRRR